MKILTLSEKNEGNWVISLPIELHFLPLCREQYGTHLAAGSTAITISSSFTIFFFIFPIDSSFIVEVH